VFKSEEDKGSEEDDNYDDRGEEEEEEDVETEESSKKFFIIYQKLDFCRAQVFKFAFTKCDLQKTFKISQGRYDKISNKLKALETEYKDNLKPVQRTHPKLLDGLKEYEDQ
jgi:TATA-binding protein-associated factor Taf7